MSAPRKRGPKPPSKPASKRGPKPASAPAGKRGPKPASAPTGKRGPKPAGAPSGKRPSGPPPGKRSAARKPTGKPTGKPTTGRPTGRPPVRRSPDRGLDGTQVEGRHAVRELLLAGTRRVNEVLIAEGMEAADILNDIVELAHDLKVPVREISKRRLDSESKTESSQGVVARAAPLQEHTLEDLATGAPGGVVPFLVAVDGVTDPGNLGAIIRTAECAGVTGLLLPRHRAVHVTPTVTKAAAGAVEHVPMTLVGGLPAAIGEMRKHGVWVVGLDAGGEKSLHRVELGDQPVCLVLGAEGEGLSRLVRDRCDQIVSIPLLGTLSSLNVSTAAALAIYEVVRRRAEAAAR